MENSTASRQRSPLNYLTLGLVYVAAVAIGITVYHVIPLEFWLKLLLADLAATVVVFAFGAAFGNASVYDPYWSVQPIVIVVGYAIFTKPLTVAMILPLIAVLLWGVRLTANWAYAFNGLPPECEDWRYQMLRGRTGKWYPLVNFFGIHLVPTLIVYLCVLPVVLTFEFAPALNVGGIVFFAVSVLAVLMQGIADSSLHKFKKKGGEGFFRGGLWKYSRHPNYLAEIIMWWAVALAAVCLMPEYWWLISGAIALTLLFLFVSIPMADRHQARKEGFALYKKNTFRLLPIWKPQHKPEEEPTEEPPAEEPTEPDEESTPEEEPTEEPPVEEPTEEPPVEEPTQPDEESAPDEEPKEPDEEPTQPDEESASEEEPTESDEGSPEEEPTQPDEESAPEEEPTEPDEGSAPDEPTEEPPVQPEEERESSEKE